MVAPVRTVMVGDGVSDLETKPVVDLFVGFGRYTPRAKVKAGAHAFVVERRAALAAQDVRVFAHVHVVGQHGLAQAVLQEGGLAVQRPARGRLHEGAQDRVARLRGRHGRAGGVGRDGRRAEARQPAEGAADDRSLG